MTLKHICVQMEEREPGPVQASLPLGSCPWNLLSPSLQGCPSCRWQSPVAAPVEVWGSGRHVVGSCLRWAGQQVQAPAWQLGW